MVDMLLVFLIGSFLVPVGADGCAEGAKAFAQDPLVVDDLREVMHAQLFSVSYYSTYKVVRYDPVLSKYKRSWPDASQRGEGIPDLVLYQCGTSKPTISHNGIGANARFYEIPLRSVALPWTGALHFVELLSATKAISLIDMTHVSSPCAQLLEVCTPSIHESISSTSWAQLAKNVEVVFTDSFGTGWSNSTRDVIFDVSLDPGTLHRAEWLKFMALFFNQEKAAGHIFSRIEADYRALEWEASKLQGAHGGPKTVAWIAWQGCKDVACDDVPAGQWVQNANGRWCRCGSFYMLSNSHFKRDATRSAGGRLLPTPSASWAPPGCSLKAISDGSQSYECDATELQHFQMLLSQADVIIDETYVLNHGIYVLNDFLKNFGFSGSSKPLRAMTNEAVFRIDGSISDPRDEGGHVGNAWYEQMPAQPQQLLSDMMKALWGDAFKGRCDVKYFRHLHSGQLQSINKHTDCPAHSPAGDHRCDEIHSLEQHVPECATLVDGSDLDAPGNHSNADGTGHLLALGLGLGLGLGLLVLICCSISRGCEKQKAPGSFWKEMRRPHEYKNRDYNCVNSGSAIH